MQTKVEGEFDPCICTSSLEPFAAFNARISSPKAVICASSVSEDGAAADIIRRLCLHKNVERQSYHLYHPRANTASSNPRLGCYE